MMNMDVMDRINQRMADLKIKQIDIVNFTGAGKSLVNQWTNGKTVPGKKYLLKLCGLLQCDPEWLLEGKQTSKFGLNYISIHESNAGYKNVTSGPDVLRYVPLISTVQAGQWSEVIDIFQPNDAEEWRETTARVGSRAFALRVVSDSMVNPNGSPSIPEDAIVIVDPDIEANNGSIVVARLDSATEATLKKLVIDGPRKFLVPLNPKYPTTEMSDDYTIVGVVKKVEMDL